MVRPHPFTMPSTPPAALQSITQALLPSKACVSGASEEQTSEILG